MLCEGPVRIVRIGCEIVLSAFFQSGLAGGGSKFTGSGACALLKDVLGFHICTGGSNAVDADLVTCSPCGLKVGTLQDNGNVVVGLGSGLTSGVGVLLTIVVVLLLRLFFLFTGNNKCKGNHCQSKKLSHDNGWLMVINNNSVIGF